MHKPKPHKEIYTRLKRSKTHGVGVIAIIDIPIGTYMFNHDNSELVWFKEDELNISSLPLPVQKLYNDFCIVSNENGIKKYGCPSSFNSMTISWYLNHSKTLNVGCDKDYDFYALHEIKAGEELLIDYDTYSEE